MSKIRFYITDAIARPINLNGGNRLVYRHILTEFKKRYDPEAGQYVKEHIYGEGVLDSIRSFGSKLFGKKSKKAASKAVSKASEHAEEN